MALALVSPAAEARRVWPLSEEGFKTARPTLGPAGRASESIAVWDEGDGQRVVSRVVDAEGRPVSAERELAAAVNGELVGGPVAAGTRAGYLVAWGRGLGAIDVAVLDRGGNPVGPVTTLPADARSLRMVYQPRSREYLVLWLDIDASGTDSTEAVFARRLNRRGELLGPAVMVSPRYPNIRSYAVEARRNRRGYLVAWNRDGSTDVAVEARALTGRGGPAGPVRAIAPGNARATVALAWSGRARTFVLATHDHRDDIQLYRVDPGGARRGRAHRVRPGPTVEQSPFVVVIAYERSSDTMLVVWQEGDEYGREPFHTADLQARRLEASSLETRGTPPVPWKRQSTFYDECCPALVAFRSGGYLVAWAGERGDGTGARIFAQGL
jgi:hypothetical protein